MIGVSAEVHVSREDTHTERDSDLQGQHAIKPQMGSRVLQEYWLWRETWLARQVC